MSLFLDRMDAGRQLAAGLREFAATPGVVLGLPRGGVPVAFALAQELRLPLDVFLVRKLGVPGQEELAMGAVAAGNVRVINAEVVRALGILPEQIARVADLEQQELERRAAAFRQGHPQLPVAGRTAIVVDDGLATGSTMRAAVQALRMAEPARILVAVPVGAADTCDRLRSEAVQVVCLHTPHNFFAVGQWYLNFQQTTDEEVKELLRRSRESLPNRGTAELLPS
ncbi:MAG: phosphoribosyltransferase [Acidobacteria bacterium]|nr:phosphoribosyltransferase [Acidobacteriota bacterium]